MWADTQRNGRPAEYRWRPDLCEISVIPFLVPRRKVWLTPSVGVPCNGAVTVPIYRTTQDLHGRKVNCARGEISSGGKSPRKCIHGVAAHGDGQTWCKVWLASGERRRCNEAKTRNPLKFAGVPQTNETVSGSQPLIGRSSPYCKDMWGDIAV